MFVLSCMLVFLLAVNSDPDIKDTNTNIKYKLTYEDATVNDIALAFIQLFGNNENGRIENLKQKLGSINTYVVDRNKYAEVLLNETKTSDLNYTNFYDALNESDHFQFLIRDGEPKNLYLRLKEKMNRDDILNILADKTQNSELAKSARKMMTNDLSNKFNKYNDIDLAVDRIIAEKPRDKHTFDYHVGDDSLWDPQGELEDLKEFHDHNARRIYKGERTTIKYYPFMVSVHVMGRFWCGGVIYNSDLVITSAACLQLLHNNRFFRENPMVLKIRIGSNHSRIGGELVDALEVYFHPGYNSRDLRHNIALIRLSRHISFNHHRVPKKIDLSHAEGIAPTSEVLILGWGVTKMTQKLSYEPIFLNRKILPVYPNVFCKEVYGKKFVTTSMFCAGTLTTGEGACDHDAGGPAIMAGKLAGIISFGPSVCGYPDTPTVFTLIGAYTDWIETIDENMPRYYQARKRTTTASTYMLYGKDFSKTTTSSRLFSMTEKSIDENTTTPGIPETGEVETETEAGLRSRDRKKLAKPDSDGWSIETVI